MDTIAAKQAMTLAEEGISTTHVTMDGEKNLRLRSNISSDGSRQESHSPGDETVLAMFGKKQQLKRRFKSISTVGLTCGLMLSWLAIMNSLQLGLANGGPAGMVWGFLGAYIGGMLQSLVMAEMASMIPLAGGAFNWVAILSPPKYRRFLSYVAGWLTVIFYQLFVIQVCYSSASVLQGLIILTVPSYTPQLWHATLISYAVCLFGLIVNTSLGQILAQIESLLLVLFVLGYFAILIPLVRMSPHRTASDVFETFLNLNGWKSDGLAFLVGWISSVGTFIGADGADHIAEEVQSATTVIPFTMWFSTLLNGAMAFGMLIALLFVTQDYVAAARSDTGWALIQIFQDGLGSVQGAAALTAINVAINILSISSVMATASRALWAFSRENGLPFSRAIVRLDAKTRLPYTAILATGGVQAVLALVSLGSAAAYQAFFSVELAAYYSAFLLAAAVMLCRRLTDAPYGKGEGCWCHCDESDEPGKRGGWERQQQQQQQQQQECLHYGPFRLGRLGVPITILAMVYTVVSMIFSFFPASVPVTAAVDMNFSVLIFGASALLMLGFWVLHGRRRYKGPVWEVGPVAVVEGVN